jgi:ABC-2 type transport system permease protein
VRHILAIAGRELRSIFSTPISYGLLTTYSVITGFFFFAALQDFWRAEMWANAQHAQAALERMNLNQGLIKPWADTLAVIYVFLIPLLTMRTFAEERSNGTMELLLTSPISASELVAGKYLAVLGLLGVLTLINSVYPAMLFLYGDPELLQTISALLALFLYGAAMGALGCFVSSLTRSQALAAIVLILVNLFFFILSPLSEAMGGGMLSDVLRYVGTQPHLQNGLVGSVTSEDLVYYGCFAFLFLFLARGSVESLRWR